MIAELRTPASIPGGTVITNVVWAVSDGTRHVTATEQTTIPAAPTSKPTPAATLTLTAAPFFRVYLPLALKCAIRPFGSTSGRRLVTALGPN